jgi:2-methylisocitrate lyase-like PEP mutase family enzyme
MENKMKQNEKAEIFANLHIKGLPLILYNAWDAGSAKAIVAGGAKAIATSSYAVAQAQGYNDGEDIPVDLALTIAARIVASVDVPVTVDIEGGYTDNDKVLFETIQHLLDQGVVGINFEDRIVKGDGLYDIDRQAQRIASIREAADKKNIDLFINARTDVFFGQGGEPQNLVSAAIDRVKAYAAAGASGFFIPGLVDDSLIFRVCAEAPLPVNVMMMVGMSPQSQLAKLGVARISYGPLSFFHAQEAIEQGARGVLA